MHTLTITISVSIGPSDHHDWEDHQRVFDKLFQSILQVAEVYRFDVDSDSVGSREADTRVGAVYGFHEYSRKVTLTKQLKHYRNILHFVQLFQSAVHLIPPLPEFGSSSFDYSFSSD